MFGALSLRILVAAQTATSTSAGIPGIRDAFEGGQVGLGVGLIVSAVLAVLARLGVVAALPEGLRPFAAALVAGLAAFSADLISGAGWVASLSALVFGAVAGYGAYAGGQKVRAARVK